VIFAAGTGHPFFTTDTTASLRALEVDVDVILKATKVDGVYSADPLKHPDAAFYPRLSYDQALTEGLQVMDATAIVLCRDNAMPLRVMVTGEPQTPSIDATLELIGRQEVLARMDRELPDFPG